MKENTYYVKNLDDWETFKKLLAFLLPYSEAFSLIYYKPSKNEKNKKKILEIKKKLAPFKIKQEQVTQWPGTITLDKQSYYQMVTYKVKEPVIQSIFKIQSIFESIGEISNWNYPDAPMDPAYYINGKAWFWSCTHEGINEIYLPDEEGYPLKSDLESEGIIFE